MRQDQSQVADELDNRSIGYKREEWEIKPELGGNEAQRPDVRRGRMRSTVAREVPEVPNNSVSEHHGTRRNVAEVHNNLVNTPYNAQPDFVEVPGNPAEDTRRNIVQIPGNPVYERYNTRT
jgi:hypothetical protein